MVGAMKYSNNQSGANPQLADPAVRDSAAPNVHKHKAHSHLKKKKKKSEPTLNPISRLSDGADTSQTSVVFSGIYKLFRSFSHLLPSVLQYLLGVGKLIPAAAPSLHGSPQERERRAPTGPSEAGSRPSEALCHSR